MHHIHTGVLALKQKSFPWGKQYISSLLQIKKKKIIKTLASVTLKSEIKYKACQGIKIPVLQIIEFEHYNFAAEAVEHFKECF